MEKIDLFLLIIVTCMVVLGNACLAVFKMHGVKILVFLLECYDIC